MSEKSTSIPSCPVSRWLRRKEARPGELIEAALDLFVERGYAATKMDDIARRAGVTKGTAYLYFPTKEALFKAVIREALLPRVERGEAIVAGANGCAWEALQALVREVWSVLSEPRIAGIPKLMCAECGNFPELAAYYKQEVIDRVMATIRGVLVRGMDSGEFRRYDDEYATRVLIAPLVMAMLWQHSFARYEDRPVDYELYLGVYLELLDASLRPAPIHHLEKEVTP